MLYLQHRSTQFCAPMYCQHTVSAWQYAAFVVENSSLCEKAFHDVNNNRHMKDLRAENMHAYFVPIPSVNSAIGLFPRYYLEHLPLTWLGAVREWGLKHSVGAWLLDNVHCYDDHRESQPGMVHWRSTLHFCPSHPMLSHPLDSWLSMESWSTSNLVLEKSGAGAA